MKATVIICGILCLFLSGCMSSPMEKSKSETAPSLSSYEYFNVAQKNVFDGQNYMAKKMRWIRISADEI